MSNSLDDRFLRAVQESHEMYKKCGARSPEKVKVLHGWVQDELRQVLGPEYELRGYSKTSTKEDRIEGAYYTKKVDVSVARDGMTVGVISIKFINSNFFQNANNYFEGQLGETANLRTQNIAFGHILVTTEPIPYKKRSGETSKHESFRDADIKRYHKLVEDQTFLHAPDVQAVCIFRLQVSEDDDQGTIVGACRSSDLRNVSEPWFKILQSDLGIGRFFDVFSSFVETRYLQRKQTTTDTTDRQVLDLQSQSELDALGNIVKSDDQRLGAGADVSSDEHQVAQARKKRARKGDQ